VTNAATALDRAQYMGSEFSSLGEDRGSTRSPLSKIMLPVRRNSLAYRVWWSESQQSFP